MYNYTQYTLEPVQDSACSHEQIEMEGDSKRGKRGCFMYKPNCDINGHYVGYKCTSTGM